MIISAIAVVIAVIGLFLDQMRYNNAAYKEYSSKVENVEVFKQEQQRLIDQNSQQLKIIQDQQIIINKLNPPK